MAPSLDIFGFVVPTFQVVLLVAFIAGALLCQAQLVWLKRPAAAIWDVLPFAAIGGILGSQLYYYLLHGSFFGGMVWYGGLLGGMFAAYLRFLRWKLPFEVYVLAGAPATALGHGFGRVGCFLAGDDWGAPTGGPLGIAFPNGAPPTTAGVLRDYGYPIAPHIPDAQLLRVHPTMLYEAAFLFLLAGTLVWVTRRGWNAGRVAALYLGGYGLWRFGIEFLRAKNDHVLFGLTTAQLISLGACAIACVLWRAGATRAASHSEPTPAWRRDGAAPAASPRSTRHRSTRQ